jgi:hypothetical protein
MTPPVVVDDEIASSTAELQRDLAAQCASIPYEIRRNIVIL